MTEHEAWVEVYSLLDKGWVGRFPKVALGEHCLVTGLCATARGSQPWTAETIDLCGAMQLRLQRVLGVDQAVECAQWNDDHSKVEVLGAVAECVRQTAPAPADPFLPVDTTTTKAVTF